MDPIETAGSVAASLALLGRCLTWRVVPARIAISLRLERLARSRPPYNRSCVPSVGPEGSVCRLRLSILGGRASVRTRHPVSLLSRCSQPEPSTLVIGWNGHYETAVGPPSEWRVRLPPGHGDPLCPPDLSNDALLAIPGDCRDRLVLTLGVAASASQTQSSSTSENSAKELEAGMLGSVSIDWNGLSRLPLYSTGYFVDSRSSSTSQPVVQPMSVDLELVAARSSPQSPPPVGARSTLADQEVTSSNMVVTHGPNSFCGVNGGATAGKTAPKNSTQLMGDGQEQEQEQEKRREQEQAKEQEQRNLLATSCCRTAGFCIRVALHLETSPVMVPHELSFLPAAACGPDALTRTITPKVPASHLYLGDFRDPCRRQRIPYLRFLWPWDDYYPARAERRTSLVSDQPWQLGSRRPVAWPKPTGTTSSTEHINGEVSARLPVTLSGFDGSIAWAGDQELRKGSEGFWTDPESTVEENVHDLGEVPCRHPVMVVEAYDMGTYSRLEHKAAISIQRLWRRGLEALRNAKEWWEYDAEMRRYNAAITVQAYYRGWKERLGVQAVKRKREIKGAAASVIQRRWR